MSWVASAIVGSAAVSYVGGRKASKDADKRQDSADATAEERLEFDREQFDEDIRRYDESMELYILDRERYDERYDQIESIFGPIEQNLGDFYNNLTADVFEAAGLTAQAETFKVAKQHFTTKMTQRGITGGAIVQGAKEMEIENAKTKAGIRRDAPFQVADAKQSFLSQRPSAGSPAGPAPQAPTGANVSNAYAGMQVTQQASADRAAASANSLYSSAGNLLMTGLMYGAQNSAAGGTTAAPVYNPAMDGSFIPGSVQA